MISTPLAIALQYFGADRDILPFDRNIKSFSIAIVILCVSFPLLTFVLNYLDQLQQRRRVKGVKSPDEEDLEDGFR